MEIFFDKMEMIIGSNEKSTKECTHYINEFKISNRLTGTGISAMKNYSKVEPKKAYLQRDDDIYKMTELIKRVINT